MATEKAHARSKEVWALEKMQHGIVTRSQLAGLGMSPSAIRHRLARGRLHRLMPGVYAVGRREVTVQGRWLAAVLACGPEALLSHRSAGALFGLLRPPTGLVEVVVPSRLTKRRPGICVYRRADSRASCRGAPAGKGGRSAIEALPRRPGLLRLRTLLDRAHHALTATALERHFLPLAMEAGLGPPRTQAQLGSHRVDFLWLELGLVVETDSLRYHRTAFKQSADQRRDNAQARSGLTTLRFTHSQVHYEPDYVRHELKATVRRLKAGGEQKLSL